MKYLYYFLGFGIFLNIIFASWWVLHSDIFFHVDIARDFLILHDIVTNHNLTLIGPRSGGILGIFHGPAWFYLNLPAFILGKGDPVIVGWFWVFLFLISLLIIYYVTLKFYSHSVALIATFLLALTQASYVRTLFNPFGAVMLAPLFFYFLVLYLKHKNIWHLTISLFVLGLLIQFQMAFGIPIAVLTTFLILKEIYQHKKYIHILAFLILLIPLSTYIVFEIRHDFLQTRTVLSYIQHGNNDNAQIDNYTYLSNRFMNIVFNSWYIFPESYWYLTGIFLSLFSYVIFIQKKLKATIELKVFLYLYLGYWTLSFFLKGAVVQYHYWPFASLSVICLAYYLSKLSNKLLILTIAFFSIFYLISGIEIIKNSYQFIGKDRISWKFNYELAKSVYKDANSDFGYYVYTPDLFGYTPRYAFIFAGNSSKNKGYSFEKKPLTYLFLNPDFYSDKTYNGAYWWVEKQVKMPSAPDKKIMYPNKIQIYKYNLTQEEMQIPSLKEIDTGIHFR